MAVGIRRHRLKQHLRILESHFWDLPLLAVQAGTCPTSVDKRGLDAALLEGPN